MAAAAAASGSSVNGALAENITVSHEIEERAAPLIEESDEDSHEDQSGASDLNNKATPAIAVDQGAFSSEPVASSSHQPSIQAAVFLTAFLDQLCR